jgi:hypothetical protein
MIESKFKQLRFESQLNVLNFKIAKYFIKNKYCAAFPPSDTSYLVKSFGKTNRTEV